MVWSAYRKIADNVRTPRNARCSYCALLGLMLWRSKKFVIEKLGEDATLAEFWKALKQPGIKDQFLAERVNYVAEKKAKGGPKYYAPTFEESVDDAKSSGFQVRGADYDFWEEAAYAAVHGPGGKVEEFEWMNVLHKGVWRLADSILLPAGVICRAAKNQTAAVTHKTKMPCLPCEQETRPILDFKAPKTEASAPSTAVLAIQDETEPSRPFYPLPPRTFKMHHDVALEVSFACRRTILPKAKDLANLRKLLAKAKPKTSEDNDDQKAIESFLTDLEELLSGSMSDMAAAYNKLAALPLADGTLYVVLISLPWRGRSPRAPELTERDLV